MSKLGFFGFAVFLFDLDLFSLIFVMCDVYCFIGVDAANWQCGGPIICNTQAHIFRINKTFDQLKKINLINGSHCLIVSTLDLPMTKDYIFVQILENFRFSFLFDKKKR